MAASGIWESELSIKRLTDVKRALSRSGSREDGDFHACGTYTLHVTNRFRKLSVSGPLLKAIIEQQVAERRATRTQQTPILGIFPDLENTE
jgi:hypothetical protein